MKYTSIYQEQADQYMVEAMNKYRLTQKDVKIETNFNGLFKIWSIIMFDSQERKCSIIEALTRAFYHYFSNIMDHVNIQIDDNHFFIYNIKK